MYYMSGRKLTWFTCETTINVLKKCHKKDISGNLAKTSLNNLNEGRIYGSSCIINLWNETPNVPFLPHIILTVASANHTDI